jgi:prepilin-type processing-associated H-X9-DG protein
MQPRPANSGWATASLVLGIVSFFIPVLGSLAAIITGAVGIKKTGPGQAGGRGMAVAGLSLGIASLALGALMMSILLPALNAAREQANIIKCQSNLRMIGTGWMMWANENKNQVPPAIDSATIGSYLPGGVPTCPKDGQPYHYVKPSESKISQIREMTQRVIVYDDPQHHDGKMVVLLADGHTEVLDKNTTADVLAKINSGQPATIPYSKR